MNFLAPLFLVGGLAVAAPIVVHLIRRTTRERYTFSSLMFLRPSPSRISRRHRIEHWLLLVLRCAALLLLALAFSRPFFVTNRPPDNGAGAARRLLVLLDVSASMRREGVWSAARAAVEAQLRRAGPADQCAVYAFDRQTRALLSFEDWSRMPPPERVALATARLAALAPSWAGTQLGQALVAAAETLAESDGKAVAGPRQIVLVSDVQSGSRLDGLQAYEWPKGVELLLVPIEAAHATNAGVQVVADNRDGVSTTADAVRVRVTNAATAKREQFRLRWADAAGANTPTLEAYVPPGQSRIFHLPRPKSGASVDRIALQGDDDAFDNMAYAVSPVPQRAAVRWIGREDIADAHGPLFFLRHAFVDTPRFAFDIARAEPDKIATVGALGSADLLFVGDGIAPATARVLRETAEAGKTVVFAVRRPEMGPALGEALGRPELSVTEASVANYAMFGDIDFRHRLFAPFADARYSDFTKIHVWHYRRIDFGQVPAAQIVARFDTHDPAIVEVPMGKGRIVVLTTGWQPEDSQIAVSSKFVPLMWSLLEMSGVTSNGSASFVVGDPIPVPAGTSAAAMELPNGRKETLPADATRFAGTNKPGIYTWVDGARRVSFAVNLDPNESRTAPLALDELERLGVPAKAAVTFAPTAVAPEKMRALEAENRQKLWWWAIAGTLVVLLVESALAGWTARRGAAAEAASV